MSTHTTVIPFRQPDAIDDHLGEVAREGARRMLAQMPIAEADAFVAQWEDLKLPDGRDRVVRARPWTAAQSRPGLGLSKSRSSKCRLTRPPPGRPCDGSIGHLARCFAGHDAWNAP
jgi:putative transposase